MEKLITSLREEFGGQLNEKNALKAIFRFIDFTKDKNIMLDRTYWVSEWSWEPICDGIHCYEETIRDAINYYNQVTAYCTTKNNRTYFPWDIYESKEECELITDFKNSFGYAWEIATNKFMSDNHIGNKLGKWRIGS